MFPVFPTLRIRRYTKARYIHAKYVSHQYLTSYQRSLSIHTSTTGGVCMARPLSAAPELKLQGARKILSKLKENILSSRWCIKINEPHSWVTKYAKSHTVSSVFTLLKTYRENYKKNCEYNKGILQYFSDTPSHYRPQASRDSLLPSNVDNNYIFSVLWMQLPSSILHTFIHFLNSNTSL